MAKQSSPRLKGLLVVGTVAICAAIGGAVALGGVASSSGTEGLREAIAQSAAIEATTPQASIQNVTSPGAVAFPAGVSYPEAVSRVYMAQATGTTPKDGKLVGALPRGAIAVIPDDAAKSVIIDLAAPYGYLPGEGSIKPATLTFYPAPAEDELASVASRGISPQKPWPTGARVDIPILPSCMYLKDGEDVGSGVCPETANFYGDASKVRGPVLP